MELIQKVKDLWKKSTTKGFEMIQGKVVQDFLPKVRVEVSRNAIVYMLHKEVSSTVDGKYRALMNIPGIHDRGMTAVKERYCALLDSEKVKKPGDIKDREKRVVATYIGALFAILPPIKKDKIDFQAIVKRIFQILDGLNIDMLQLSNTTFAQKLSAAAMSPDMAIFLNFIIGAGEDTKYEMDEHKQLFATLFEILDAHGGMPDTDKRCTWMALGLQVMFSKVTVQPSLKLQKVFDTLEAAKSLGKTMRVKTAKDALKLLEGDMTENAKNSSQAILDFIMSADPTTLERELPLLINSLREMDEHLGLKNKLVMFMIPVVRDYIGQSITVDPRVRSYAVEGGKASIKDDHGSQLTTEHDWLELG